MRADRSFTDRAWQARTNVDAIMAAVSLMLESGLPCFGHGEPLKNLYARFHMERTDKQAAEFMRATIADAYDKVSHPHAGSTVGTRERTLHSPPRQSRTAAWDRSERRTADLHGVPCSGRRASTMSSSGTSKASRSEEGPECGGHGGVAVGTGPVARRSVKRTCMMGYLRPATCQWVPAKGCRTSM